MQNIRAEPAPERMFNAFTSVIPLEARHSHGLIGWEREKPKKLLVFLDLLNSAEGPKVCLNEHTTQPDRGEVQSIGGCPLLVEQRLNRALPGYVAIWLTAHLSYHVKYIHRHVEVMAKSRRSHFM